MIRQAILTLALALTLPVGLAGDMPERGRELMRLVPELDPQVAGHLVRDSEAEFRKYCQEIGPGATIDAMGALNLAGARDSTPEAHVRYIQKLYPHLCRTADAMSYVFGRPEFARIYQFRVSMRENKSAHEKLLAALDQLIWDNVSSLESKLPRYEAIAKGFARLGDGREIMNVEANLAGAVMSEGLFDLRVQLLRSALARARWYYDNHMICQLLGELGDAYGRMGHRDSLIACYEEGIARADRFVIPDQAARIRRFLGRFYVDEGRLAVGARYLQEALAVSRRHDDDVEIRPLLEVTEYYAGLQCWDLVERNAQRFPALLRKAERKGYHREAAHMALAARRVHAAGLAGQGRVTEAVDSLENLVVDLRATSRQDLLLLALKQLAEVQLQAGDVQDAIAAARAGMALAESTRHSHIGPRMALVLARAAVAGHRPDLADSALELARKGFRTKFTMPVAEHLLAGIGARVALERGDVFLAERRLRRGLASLRDTIRSFDRGPHSDLTVQASEDLRLAGHQIMASDPKRQLAFERYWRSLASYGTKGASVRTVTSSSYAEPRTMQLVYTTMPEGIVRWTSSSSGVRRDALALDPLECRRLVEHVFQKASRDPADPEAPISADLVDLARRLGRSLLPEELQTGKFDRVSISADGPLSRLPFELLDLSRSGGYEPLLERMEVRYARDVRARAHRTGIGPTVILADSEAVTAKSRGRGLLPRLTAVGVEIASARDRLPDVRIVGGKETSKQALLEAWERASIVYVAAHLVRDEQAPLFNYFPIAFKQGPVVAEDQFLDIGAVRDTDLSRCRLVVLSSCASGEPYVAGTRSGPSMADAFLDAGAKAVIHTRWRVRDESAAETAPRLAEAWLDGTSPQRTSKWRGARIDRIRGPRGIRHPFEWAAWSVTTPVPVSEWNGAWELPSARRTIASTPPLVRQAANPERGE